MENDRKINAIQIIVDIEWALFDQVNNINGRASCQDDMQTFFIMRKSQFNAWPLSIIESYLVDLREALINNRNPVMEKYAYMLEKTDPTYFMKIEASLPDLSETKLNYIHEIMPIQIQWVVELEKKYPKIMNKSRPLYSTTDSMCITSYETYLNGELKSYSETTLEMYLKYVLSLFQTQRNLFEIVMVYMLKEYGYNSLEDAEGSLGDQVE